MQRTDTGFYINTYNNGVLHFVIGRKYKAVGTCGMAKDVEVIGELVDTGQMYGLELINDRGVRCAINERTLSYL